MWVIASIANAIFNVLLAPFRALHPLIGILVLSILTGVVMVFIFGKTSNQRAIHSTKSKLKAHIAEIWLFRDDLLQMLLATVRVLGHTSRYFFHSLRPLIFIFVPVLIILVMIGMRYEHRPFVAGERAFVSVQVNDPTWAQGDRLALTGTDGVAVTSPPLRILAEKEIDWQIEARAPGRHELTLTTPNGEVTKEIVVAAEQDAPLVPLAPMRGNAFSGAFLQFPAEPPLPGGSGIRLIDVVGWPHREMAVFGLGVHWLVAFFLLSMAAGFAVKDLFGVEV